jgi:hypothetical protein
MEKSVRGGICFSITDQTRPEPNIFAEYYTEGAMDLITFASPHKLSQSISLCVNQAYSLHSNSSAYDRFVLRSRVLCDI